MPPGNNDIILGINLQALEPDAALLEVFLILKLHGDMATLLIDLSSQKRCVLTLVVEVENKDAIYTGRDQSIVFIAEVRKVDQPDRRHVYMSHHF